MKICPSCGHEIFCAHIYCPYCKKPIIGYFSIEVFLKENFHLFAIIGAIGTMIALLPTLGDKIIGNDWIYGDLGILSIFLVLLFVFGSLFLWGVFVILFFKIWRFHSDEVSDFQHILFSWWKKGDRSRLMLTFCLSLLMIAVVGFILFSVLTFPNPFAAFTALLLFLGMIFMIPIIIAGRSVIDLMRQIFSIEDEMKILGILLVAAFIFWAIVVYFPPPPDERILPINAKIKLDEQFYSSGMSSSPILKLTATNTSSNSYKMHSQIWSANYGYFVSIQPMGSKIIILGNPAKKTDASYFDKVMYWTSTLNESQKEKNPLVIHLDIMNFTTNESISNNSLIINWKNNEIASVNRSI
jgi:hypothetical protein